jgi:FK506-binding protein 1
MGVTKTIIRKGDGASPQKGDKVTIEYTGWIKDTTKPDNKGSQ